MRAVVLCMLVSTANADGGAAGAGSEPVDVALRRRPPETAGDAHPNLDRSIRLHALVDRSIARLKATVKNGDLKLGAVAEAVGMSRQHLREWIDSRTPSPEWDATLAAWFQGVLADGRHARRLAEGQSRAIEEQRGAPSSSSSSSKADRDVGGKLARDALSPLYDSTRAEYAVAHAFEKHARFGAWHVDLSQLRRLLESGEPPDQPDSEGATLLSRAAARCEYIDLGVTQLLLEHGADPSSVDHEGRTPLTKAARAWTHSPKAGEIIWELLDAGARMPRPPEYDDEMWSAAKTKMDELHSFYEQERQDGNQLWAGTLAAIRHGNVASLRTRLERGMSPNVADADGRTLLFLAGLPGQAISNITKLLLDHGARRDKLADTRLIETLVSRNTGIAGSGQRESAAGYHVKWRPDPTLARDGLYDLEGSWLPIQQEVTRDFAGQIVVGQARLWLWPSSKLDDLTFSIRIETSSPDGVTMPRDEMGKRLLELGSGESPFIQRLADGLLAPPAVVDAPEDDPPISWLHVIFEVIVLIVIVLTLCRTGNPLLLLGGAVVVLFLRGARLAAWCFLMRGALLAARRYVERRRKAQKPEQPARHKRADEKKTVEKKTVEKKKRQAWQVAMERRTKEARAARAEDEAAAAAEALKLAEAKAVAAAEELLAEEEQEKHQAASASTKGGTTKQGKEKKGKGKEHGKEQTARPSIPTAMEKAALEQATKEEEARLAAEHTARQEAAKDAAELKQAQERALEAVARAKAAAERAAAERAAAREEEELRETEERAAAKTRHIEEHDRMFEAMQVHEASGGSRGAASSSSPADTEFEPERRAAAALVVPEIFLCPITTELMRDPVSTLDGLTYERIAIETWLATNDTSPLTGEQLASKMLIPNFLARGQIRELLEQHPGLDA